MSSPSDGCMFFFHQECFITWMHFKAQDEKQLTEYKQRYLNILIICTMVHLDSVFNSPITLIANFYS